NVRRAGAEVPQTRERGARVERAAARVVLDQEAARGEAARVQVVLRPLLRVAGGLLVVVVVALERQPVENAVDRLGESGVAGAIGVDVLVRQPVQRVRGVRQQVRDLRRVGRAV